MSGPLPGFPVLDRIQINKRNGNFAALDNQDVIEEVKSEQGIPSGGILMIGEVTTFGG